jgi:hypothetical protein
MFIATIYYNENYVNHCTVGYEIDASVASVGS